MKTKQIFRTLCLVAVMCMVSANALAYDVYDGHGGNIDVSGSCKILVVEEDAMVNNCEVNDGGVLIIKEGKTLTVKNKFEYIGSTIYVYGTLNIEQCFDSKIIISMVYVMQGGRIVGSFTNNGSTIFTNLNPATEGSFVKVDAQVPNPANSFVGWPDYYQRCIYSTDGTDFYPLGDYFEDAAHTQPIADLDAWKTNYSNYSNIYHAAYDAGVTDGYDTGYASGKEDGKAEALGSMGPECTDCPAVVVTKGDKSVRLYQPDKVEFIRVAQ